MVRNFAGFLAAAGLVVCVACGQSDAGITTSVKTKLAADDTVKAYQVDVDTSNHVVTLRGTVDNPAAKAMAVQIARNTDGVRDVIDQITISETTAPTSGRLDVDVNPPDAHVTVEHDNAAERAGHATVEGAKKAGDATVEGAKKVGAGAKKLGEKAVDAVTDDNRDSDHDGK
jgi:hypothetical protein